MQNVEALEHFIIRHFLKNHDKIVDEVQATMYFVGRRLDKGGFVNGFY